MHINGGLVVNLGNTCAESKGSGAEKEVWHVQQLCGCRHCRALWSSVLRCDRVLADSEPGAGWGWGWTGPYGLSESVRKGTCQGARRTTQQSAETFPKNFWGSISSQTWSARIRELFLEFVWNFQTRIDKSRQNKERKFTILHRLDDTCDTI